MGKGQKQKKAQTLSLAEFAAVKVANDDVGVGVSTDTHAIKDCGTARKDCGTARKDCCSVKDTSGAFSLDVIIVGAGASGVGCALMLTKTFGLDASRVMLIERGEAVGDTFRRWPAEMRFISPSFNQQGWTSSFDLNSIAHGTSPAYSLHAEHPTGDEYADYLNALASAANLRVRTLTEVMHNGIHSPHWVDCYGYNDDYIR